MFKNYLKIAFRNLTKKKVFSFINIFGLALGMAACLSIFYYVNYELSYDEFITDSEDIYRFYFSRDMETETKVYMNPGTALKHRLDEIPQISGSFRTIQKDYQNNSLIYDSDGARSVIEQLGVQYADKQIGEVLDLEMAAGSFSSMNEPMKMVLTEKVANKFFENKDALGKTITVSGNIGNYDYEVVGVIKDLPSNSQFDLKVMLSMPSLKITEGSDDYDVTNAWNSWNTRTYIKAAVGHGELLSALKANVTDREEFQGDETTWHAKVMPITDYHLTKIQANDTLDYSAKNLVYGLAAIGVFILLIAWINFINLSTARAMERAKEVGVRKALGSHQNQIRKQFLIESFVINLLAAILALTIVQLALPSIYNVDDLMSLNNRDAIIFWSAFIGMLLIGSLLSGLYPAFVLSGFRPVVVLKGKIADRNGGELLRKGLVIFQFAASSFMIIGTFIIYEQITYMQSKDLGLNIDNVLIMDAPPGNVNGDNDFYRAVNSFKEEVQKLNAVRSISASSDVPGRSTGWNTSMYLPNETTDERRQINLLAVDKDFADAYGLHLEAGRFYQAADGTFDKGNIVINEAAVKLFGFENANDAIGKNLIEGRMFPELTIIGVIKNFHQESLREEITPMAFVKSNWSNFYSLSLNINEDLPAEQRAENLRVDLAQIEGIWNKFFPDFPFDYTFLNQRFDAQYKSDKEFGFIITLFACLSIIIACLGLLGLASYSVAQRTKEIGIRKVLGASVVKIFNLLSVQYVYLVLISSIVAIPLAYYVVNLWLGEYAYKVEVQWWMFAIPVATTLLVALITVATQVLNATGKNPVDSLRYE